MLYIQLIYINWINLLILYKHFLSFFIDFNDEILKIPGNKLKQNGYNKDSPKLKSVSLIRWIWVFLYKAQNDAK